jgi:hypothetical protein
MPLPHYGGNQKPFKPGKYKEYVYLGENIDASKLIWDILTLEPQSIKFYTGHILPHTYSGERGNEFFKKMFEDGYFVEVSKYRDDRINQILEE